MKGNNRVVNIQLTAVVSDWGFSVYIYKNTQVFPISIPLALLGRMSRRDFRSHLGMALLYVWIMQEGRRATDAQTSVRLPLEVETTWETSVLWILHELSATRFCLAAVSKLKALCFCNRHTVSLWPHSHSWCSGIWGFLGIIDFFGTSALINTF